MEEYKNLVNMEKCQNFIKELLQILRNLCGLTFSRFMLFLINSGFVIIGTLLGVAAIFVFCNEYSFRVWIHLIIAAWILIVMAAIMMFVAFVGAFASSRECAVLTNFYWFVLLVLFIMSVNAAITTSIVSTSIITKMENNLIHSIKNGNSEWELHKWMNLQKQLDCCGAQGPEDWNSLKVENGLNYTTNGNTFVVPFSCCRISSGLICDNAYHGCIGPITGITDICLIVLGYVAGVSMILQILGMIFASLHVRNIRRFKTVEEMKKQELQHLLFNEESTN